MQRYRLIRLFFPAVVFILLLTQCLVVDNTYSGLPPGPWRAVLKLENNPVTPNPKGAPLPEKLNMTFDEVTEGELPFNFEVKYDSKDRFHIEIKNADELIRIDSIIMGRDRRTAKDTVIIRFPSGDTYIRAIFEENLMEGNWIDPAQPNFRIHFVAWHGDNYRFTNLRKTPTEDVSGRWEISLGLDTDAPYKAVAELTQQGNYLTGSLITASGEYQHLEGSIQADKLYLSRFDGVQALLLEAKLKPEGLIGSMRLGNGLRTIWSGRRNADFQLPEKTNQQPEAKISQ